uniref:Protein roadkill n=2 Tax=Culex pipiens TaxID=7175 RepID=A0A8D8BK06_CULPI
MSQFSTTETVTFYNEWKILNFSRIPNILISETYNNLNNSISWFYAIYFFKTLCRNRNPCQYATIIITIVSCNSLTKASVEIDQAGIVSKLNGLTEVFKISGETIVGESIGNLIIGHETLKKFVEGDTLTLRFKFTLPKPPALKPVKSELLQNYTSLLSNKQLSDVTIQVGKKTFYAQRAILSIRSPVFAAMFQSGMQESQQNLITIEDIRPEVVQEVLRFIYTDEVIGLETMAHELLAAADKYSLDKLRKMCENHLMGHLEQETILQTLVLADLYHAQKLKDHAIHFICENIKTMQGTDWKSFSSTRPDLVADIFNKMSIK